MSEIDIRPDPLFKKKREEKEESKENLHDAKHEQAMSALDSDSFKMPEPKMDMKRQKLNSSLGSIDMNTSLLNDSMEIAAEDLENLNLED